MIARATRESLVTALAVRKLDRTLTSALDCTDQYDEATVAATAVAALDARLGGGVPRGQLSEIVGPQSSGRTSLLWQLMAAATARGELVALVDALDRFDPAAGEAAGIDLSRLLWIRGRVVTTRVLSSDPSARAIEQALKALTLVLQAGNFGIVALDIGDAPGESVARLPFTTWMRLQRLVEGQPTVGLLVARAPVARSAAGLTIALQPRQEAAAARRFAARSFAGLGFEARVVRARLRGPDDRVLACATRAVPYV